MIADLSEVVLIDLDIILVSVLEEVSGSENPSDFDELIGVRFAFKKWLSVEYHSCEHSPETPHI